jgi:two-component system sensor histidine kinase UhpB
VSFPVAVTELVVLAAGLALMLGIDLFLLRRAFGPLARLTRLMRGVDPLRPGVRAPVESADPDVAELSAAFNDMLQRLEFERRESARRALAGQEGERLRISRELHDEVGQVLTAVVLQLERAARRVNGEVRADVEEAREAVRSVLEDVRDIAQRLRPEALDMLGLPSALAALGLEIERRAGLAVDRDVAPELPPLEPEHELVVYRVAQEALTNVARHAGARRAAVALRAERGRVVMEVRDDGDGFDTERVHLGAGLRGMRERAVLIGADLDIRSAPRQGTVVTLRLP